MPKTRIVTALILAAGFLAAIFFLPPGGAAAVFAAIVAIAAWEWAGLLGWLRGVRLLYAALTLVACGLVYFSGLPQTLRAILWLASAAFWLLVVPLWLKRKWRLRGNAIGPVVGWLVLVPSWAGMVALQRHGPLILLAAMALVWVADIAAYFGGRSFGRHKLAPSLSPGKTWEGALAGLVGVEIYGLVVAAANGWIGAPTEVLAALFALAAAAGISMLGDLFESLAKRQAGAKDSGTILPGHGGVLDRIDSLTSTLPFAALAAMALTSRAT